MLSRPTMPLMAANGTTSTLLELNLPGLQHGGTENSQPWLLGLATVCPRRVERTVPTLGGALHH